MSFILLTVFITVMGIPACSYNSAYNSSPVQIRSAEEPVIGGIKKKGSKKPILDISHEIAGEILEDLARAEKRRRKNAFVPENDQELINLENYPVAIMTLTDANDFQTSADFGRTLTECLIASFEQEGFNVLELRKTCKVHMEKGNGEYFLSRDISKIDSKTRFSRALVGTYTITSSTVIVNVRLLDVLTGKVLASSSKETEMDEQIWYLLTNGGTLTRVVNKIPYNEIYLKGLGVSVFDRTIYKN